MTLKELNLTYVALDDLKHNIEAGPRPALQKENLELIDKMLEDLDGQMHSKRKAIISMWDEIDDYCEKLVEYVNQKAVTQVAQDDLDDANACCEVRDKIIRVLEGLGAKFEYIDFDF